MSIVLGYFVASIFLTTHSTRVLSPRRAVHLPSASRVQRIPFRSPSAALCPLFSVKMGLHVPARAFSSFVKTSSCGSPEALGEPRPANSKKVTKRVFRVMMKLRRMEGESVRRSLAPFAAERLPAQGRRSDHLRHYILTPECGPWLFPPKVLGPVLRRALFPKSATPKEQMVPATAATTSTVAVHR